MIEPDLTRLSPNFNSAAPTGHRGKMRMPVIEAPERRGNVLRHGTDTLEVSMQSDPTYPHSSRHGLSRTPTWNSWDSMLKRCYLKKHQAYERYGGRGITVCDRWNPRAGGSFLNFLADMGTRPEGLSLDRINNDGNYEPGNCRWATLLEQARGRKEATHCIHGHPFDADNTYIDPKTGKRQCKICKNGRKRAARHG